MKRRVFNRADVVAAGHMAFKVDGAYYTSSGQLATNLVLALDVRAIDDLKSMTSSRILLAYQRPELPADAATMLPGDIHAEGT